MKKIISLEVKKSKFFKDGIKINFSSKLNCIMGGRGTGKTTLLYFIKAAIDKNSEDNNFVNNLLDNNLGQGEIKLEIEAEDGNKYSISKYFEEDPQPTRLSDNKFISIDRISRDIEVDIFEASAIERIGRKSEDRLVLIDKMISDEIQDYYAELKTLQINLNENAQDIKTLNAKINQKMQKIKLFESAETDFDEHKKNQPKGINKLENEEFKIGDKNQKLRIGEGRFIKKVKEFYGEFADNTEELIEQLDDFVSNNVKDEKELLNKKIMGKVYSNLNKLIKVSKANLSEIVKNLKSSDNTLKLINNELLKSHEKQENEFVKLRKRIEKHRQYFNKFNELSKKVDEKKVLVRDKDELSKKMSKIKASRIKLMENFNKLKQDILGMRLKKVVELNKLFKGQIKITLTPGGIVNKYEELLKKALKGTGLTYNILAPKIVQNVRPDKLAQIVFDKDVDELRKISGIDKIRSRDVIDNLYDKNEIYDIETTYCPDLPFFYLKIENSPNDKSENYKKSDDLSTGQRCTTVLPIVFAVSNNPLIIDQPEDNLDNKYISESIFKIISEQKQNRQLIFITHNPNIPVLPDSDFNIFLKYDKYSEIDDKGNIDDVKKNILKLLEGGKEAFEKRRTIYAEKSK